MEWHNTKKSNEMIDISNEMHGGTIFDNNVIFIDFGPELQKPKRKVLEIKGKIVPCSGNCSYCKYYCGV